MYADDLILISETEDGLQKCLNKLAEYVERWQLSINIKKTKIIIFQRGGRLPCTIFYLGNQIVEKVKQYKYLGTIISYTGNFAANEVNLKKKGLRASYLILKTIGMNSKPSTSIKIFEKIVEPILLYNCEVSLAYMPKTWNLDKFKNKLWDTGEEVNKVVLSFLRQILGIHKKSPTLPTLAEVGKYPLCVKIFITIVKYWVRISSSENRLLAAAKQSILTQNMKGKQNWLKMVEYLFNITNITQHPTLNKSSNDRLIITFKRNIKTEYERWWRLQMQSIESKKYDFFYKYKKNYKFENYLDYIPRQIRLFTTRLRTSSHNLPVETMRYIKDKPDWEDRKCDICNINVVGDEHHYLL